MTTFVVAFVTLVSGVLSGPAFAATAPPAAESAATWSIEQVPTPKGDPHAVLRDVSCPTASFCMAVGSYFALSGARRPLVMVWDGHSWRRAADAGLTRQTLSLGIVECVDRHFCFALPTRLISSVRLQPFRWTGSRWVAARLPHPHVERPTDVSCAGRRGCLAIGRDSAGEDSWRWTGSRWRPVAVPHAAHVHLAAVSCPAAGVCHAAGTWVGTAKPKHRALVADWVKGVWHTRRVTKSGGELSALSCPSRTACTAVGATPNGVKSFLVENLRNGTWTGGTRAVPGLIGRAGFPATPRGIAVSCRSTTVCSAVAAYYNRDADQWSAEVAVRGGHGGFRSRSLGAGVEPYDLLSVSCVPRTCTFVAEDPNYFFAADAADPVILRGTGVAPHTQRVRAPASPAGLNQVSCSHAGLCAITTSGRPRVMLKQPGQRWTTTSAHLGANPHVSCTGRRFCMATSSNAAASWNGSSWTRVPLPRSSRNELDQISCLNPHWCEAVGLAMADVDKPLIEHWDGQRWQPVPANAPKNSRDLGGISCLSRSFCLAGGAGPVGPLLERWDGTSWHVLSAGHVDPGGGVTAISCTSSKKCLIADDFGQVLLWNGTSLRILKNATDRNGIDGVIDSIACVTDTVCYAVGLNTFTPHLHAFMEVLRAGAWHVVHGPALDARTSRLVSVTCTAARCRAVGYRVGDRFTPAPLPLEALINAA